MNDYETEKNDFLHLSHALLYLFTAKQFTKEYGLEGERAIRGGVRRAGTNRGIWLANRQKALGMKTNLKNHIEYNINVLKGLSFTEKVYALTPEEDVRDCMYCPTTKAMIERGERSLAVAYCEELHPALWQGYAPGTIVNLGKTLAQEGSDRCTFCIYLRPGRLTEEQRRACFEEYDPDFKGDRREEFRYMERKEAAVMKSIVMLGGLFDSCVEFFPERGRETFVRALENLFENLADGACDIAAKYGIVPDSDYLEDNVLFGKSMEEDNDQGYWDEFFVSEEFRKFALESLYPVRNRVIAEKLKA